MLRRSTVVTLLAALAFAALLLYSTLASQRTECAVTVEFRGQRNAATATAANADEAAQQAQQTACGPIAVGMNETIACTNRPPVSVECRSL